MTGQAEIYEDGHIAPVLASAKLQGTLAYEFRRYARTMQMQQSQLVRKAIEEYLTARGVVIR